MVRHRAREEAIPVHKLTRIDSYTAPHNIIRGTYPQLIAFLVLNIWPAYLGMPVLLAILCFSKGVKRHPTLANLLAAFIVIGMCVVRAIIASLFSANP